MKKIFLAFIALIILSTASIVIYAKYFTDVEPQFTEKLNQIAPPKLEGWKVKEIPLAESAGMLAHVLRTLKFDDYVSREYTKEDLTITFYAAYWTPGKRSPIDAGGHNPDACWINFGWTRTKREYSVAGTKIADKELIPYEFGIYQKDGITLPAIFWHLVNGKPHVYQDKRIGWKDGFSGVFERLPRRFEDFKKLGFNQRREQLFIRISCQGKTEQEMFENPNFQDFMLKIGKLGIFKDTAWGEMKQEPTQDQK